MQPFGAVNEVSPIPPVCFCRLCYMYNVRILACWILPISPGFINLYWVFVSSGLKQWTEYLYKQSKQIIIVFFHYQKRILTVFTMLCYKYFHHILRGLGGCGILMTTSIFISLDEQLCIKGSFTNFKSIATGYYSKYLKNLRNAVYVLNIKKCRDEQEKPRYYSHQTDKEIHRKSRVMLKPMKVKKKFQMKNNLNYMVCSLIYMVYMWSFNSTRARAEKIISYV